MPILFVLEMVTVGFIFFTDTRRKKAFSNETVFAESLSYITSLLFKTNMEVNNTIERLKTPPSGKMSEKTFRPKSSVENLLGKKEYGKMNKAVFNRVLKRETGIVSKDYLEDLTRILASMDMHYMQKKATAAHDVNAIKIAYAGLFGTVTNASYKKTKLKQLMSVQGLQGNYRNIMKFALHKTANG